MNKRARHLFLSAICLIPLMGGLPSIASADDTCYEKAADGTCLDNQSALPTTGQFTNSADQQGATTPTGLRSTAAHANVRLAQATFVLAHNICRYVDNPGSRGRAIFIGLEDKSEWTSFIATPPSGVALQYCCQPVTVSICGTSVTVPFGVSGASHSYSGGYDFKATYACGTVTSGVAPTADTSWVVTTSGSCSAPVDTTPYCHNGDKGDATCPEDGGDTAHQHDGGHHGPGGGGKGDGGDAGSG